MMAWPCPAQPTIFNVSIRFAASSVSCSRRRSVSSNAVAIPLLTGHSHRHSYLARISIRLSCQCSWCIPAMLFCQTKSEWLIGAACNQRFTLLSHDKTVCPVSSFHTRPSVGPSYTVYTQAALSPDMIKSKTVIGSAVRDSVRVTGSKFD